ncbi:efflux transporter outer membrane subunit [Pseudoduganella sp. RAF53_2]|uniref:efflux transporter outer membrane subunit n=1 Tax=unclassified Pseudoduganella TaxID=2637179 RepID=UPI003F95F084
MANRMLIAALSAALLGGCALQPAYQRPASPVPATYPAGEAYAKSQAHPASGPSMSAASTTPSTRGAASVAADLGWRNFFVDPRLQRLVELSLQNNRDLRVAVLNAEKVRAKYQIQRSALFPQLGAAASSTARNGVPRNDLAQFTAAWEIDLFGRLRSLSDAAQEQYFASAYGRQAAQTLLVSQVADQYLTMLAYDEELAVTQRTLDTAQASYKLVKLQFDTGTASELDLRQSQIVVDRAQSSHAAQVRQRAQAENALVLLIGQSLPADLPPHAPLGAQTLTGIPAGLPSDLLARRPDILQAEALLRSENANIGAARAAFFPQITLTGAIGSGAWSFVPALVEPIFDAGRNKANLDVATLEKDIGVAQYEKAIQTAFREVSDGLAARGTYDDQLAALQRETDAQQRRLDLANSLYENGVNSYLDVLTAQTDLYNDQISLISARLDQLTSRVNLYRALGGGWLERTMDAHPTTGAP